MTTRRATHLEVIRRSGILDSSSELGQAMREAIARFTELADGCTDPVSCATEQHPESRANPIEFLDWLRLEVDPPNVSPHGGHLSITGRARVIAGQRRRWSRSLSVA